MSATGMKRPWPVVIGMLMAGMLASCQSLPQNQFASYFNESLDANSRFELEAVELKSLSSLDMRQDLNTDLAIQAARKHGVSLARADSPAEGGPNYQISIRINEQAYDYEVQRIQSIACVLKITKIQAGETRLIAQFMSTEDCTLALASAGYVYGLLDRMFGQVAKHLAKPAAGD